MSQLIAVISMISSIGKLGALAPLLVELVTLVKSKTATFDQYLAWLGKVIAALGITPAPGPKPVPEPFVVGAAAPKSPMSKDEFVSHVVSMGCSEHDAKALANAASGEFYGG